MGVRACMFASARLFGDDQQQSNPILTGYVISDLKILIACMTSTRGTLSIASEI